MNDNLIWFHEKEWWCGCAPSLHVAIWRLCRNTMLHSCIVRGTKPPCVCSWTTGDRRVGLKKWRLNPANDIQNWIMSTAETQAIKMIYNIEKAKLAEHKLQINSCVGRWDEEQNRHYSITAPQWDESSISGPLIPILCYRTDFWNRGLTHRTARIFCCSCINSCCCKWCCPSPLADDMFESVWTDSR